MARYRAKPNPAWSKRAPSAPWTADEDARVIDMAECGVALWARGDFLPERSDGEIIERTYQLREAGRVTREPSPL